MFNTLRLPFTLILFAALTAGLMAGAVAQEESEKPVVDRAKDPSKGTLTLNKAGTTPEILTDSEDPTIHFPEPEHDFGTISRGVKVSHIFKVQNVGAAPLRLIKAKGS